MGLKSCEIFFDNQWNTYYAGQTINGRVDFTFDSPKKIRGITIRFKGECNTSWSESEHRTGEDGKSVEETTQLTGHEEYFTIQYYLIGSQTGGEMELEAGKHTYHFTCALPPTLPSSFEGEWGHIRYTVKVNIDRPWKFDQDTKVAFTVVSPVDLNLNPRVKDPIKRELEKTFCCCWCRSGPLGLVVSLPCTGFVSGQKIPITAECDNASNITVDTLRFTLRKVVTFHSQSPRRATKKSKVVISELAVGPVNAGDSHTSVQLIEVPPLPPSNLANCGIIDLDYDLKVEVNVSGLHSGLETKIPVIIGTIPLQDAPTTLPYSDIPVAQIESMNNGGGMIAVPSDAQPVIGDDVIGWTMPTVKTDGQVYPQNLPPHHAMYPNIPNPTYAESQFSTKSIHDHHDTEHTRYSHGTQRYSPRYPVYFYSPTAPAPAN